MLGWYRTVRWHTVRRSRDLRSARGGGRAAARGRGRGVGGWPRPRAERSPSRANLSFCILLLFYVSIHIIKQMRTLRGIVDCDWSFDWNWGLWRHLICSFSSVPCLRLQRTTSACYCLGYCYVLVKPYLWAPTDLENSLEWLNLVRKRLQFLNFHQRLRLPPDFPFSSFGGQ